MQAAPDFYMQFPKDSGHALYYPYMTALQGYKPEIIHKHIAFYLSLFQRPNDRLYMSPYYQIIKLIHEWLNFVLSALLYILSTYIFIALLIYLQQFFICHISIHCPDYVPIAPFCNSTAYIFISLFSTYCLCLIYS